MGEECWRDQEGRGCVQEDLTKHAELGGIRKDISIGDHLILYSGDTILGGLSEPN